MRIAGTEAFFGALRRARSVEVSAYVLRRDSRLARALADAAHGGAAVRVAVDGNPYGDERGGMRRATLEAARGLRAAGATVDVVTDRPLHMKAAVVDGTAYLDDRNWTNGGRDMVVATDDQREVALVRDAIEHAAVWSGQRVWPW